MSIKNSVISFFNKGQSIFCFLHFYNFLRNAIYAKKSELVPVARLVSNLYCDTKSRNYRLFNEGSDLCLNPASLRCDPAEACAHGASMMGMKPS
jgi:hypothetical protein